MTAAATAPWERAERTWGGELVSVRAATRREKFLDAAWTVFANAGWTGSSIAAICKEVKLSSRQFYEEWGSRERILRDLVEIGFRRVHFEVGRSQWGLTDPAARFDAAMVAYIESIGTDRRRAQVLLIESVSAGADVKTARSRERATWLGLLGIEPDRRTALLGAVEAVAYEWSTSCPRPDIASSLPVLRRIGGLE